MNTNPSNMRVKFANRAELIAYLREQFPQATAIDDHISDIVGGRKNAKISLEKINPIEYEKTRNFLDGKVTKLSPYIRHGVLSLAEVRDYVFNQVDHPQDAEKLINELGWRDYWQRLYEKLGDDIWQDQEEYKTGFSAHEYAHKLPEDIIKSATGLLCIDKFSQELKTTGYLHNHQRMWLAAYIIHWRKIRWQAGAQWFLTHLLDGDPASNNLSWQWVASTFSHKPYFFNRENLQRYSKGVYCDQCPLKGECDFEGSYEEIEVKLFPKTQINRDRGSQNWNKPRNNR
jgi:deoxyribodipyrimidine photo-lyase